MFGNNIEDWNVKALRENIAYVGQESFLFPESIFMNVKLGKKDASDEEVLKVIKELKLDELDIYKTNWRTRSATIRWTETKNQYCKGNA